MVSRLFVNAKPWGEQDNGITWGNKAAWITVEVLTNRPFQPKSETEKRLEKHLHTILLHFY